MRQRISLVAACLVVFALILAAPGDGRFQGHQEPPSKQKGTDQEGKLPRAWTVQEAREQLHLHPHDPYLQYVYLQVVRREKRDVDEAIKEVETLPGAAAPELRPRADGVNLFGLFSGALAVQESLQLEALRGRPRSPRHGGKSVTNDKVVKVTDLK